MIIIFSLEKAKDLYDEILDDDASAIKCEAANKLTYITKALMDLAKTFESIDDLEFIDRVKAIINEGVEENGFTEYGINGFGQ